MAIRSQIGDPWTIAVSRANLAALSLEEGQPAAAEALARQASEELRKLKANRDLAVTYSVLARSLLEQGKTSEARSVIQTAQELSARTDEIPVHFEVDIAGARVGAAEVNHYHQGQTAAPKQTLEGVLAQATRHGYLGYQFQARLALGEVDMASDNAGAGRARLATLEKDAEAKGFGLIARKAARVNR